MNEEDVISLFYAKSHFETYEILIPLARKGNKFASYFLGNMLVAPIDQTVEQNILLGIDFLKSSAKAGYPPAFEFLGNLYAYNEQVHNDLFVAHTFFYLAATLENKIDIGYHLIVEDEFKISKSDVNKSIENAKSCIEVGLENCKLLNNTQ